MIISSRFLMWFEENSLSDLLVFQSCWKSTECVNKNVLLTIICIHKNENVVWGKNYLGIQQFLWQMGYYYIIIFLTIFFVIYTHKLFFSLQILTLMCLEILMKMYLNLDNILP